MPSGYRNGGVDFDDLFDPDIMGDGPSVPNLRSGGAPLKYAHIQYGAKRADVGYRQGGVDVSSLWAAKGTAVYDVLLVPLVSLYSSSYPPVSNAHCGVFYMPDGTVAGFKNNPDAQEQGFGTWISSGNPLNYEFRFTKEAGDDPTNGTFGVWLPASAAPGIGFDLYTNGSRYLQFTVEVRRIGSGTPYAIRTGNNFTLEYNAAGGPPI